MARPKKQRAEEKTSALIFLRLFNVLITGKSAGCPASLLQARGGRKRTPAVESKPTL